MSWSLLDLQNQIANEMDQSATAPSQGGTDWNIRLNSLNRAQIDWAESYDWEVLKKVHNGIVSTSTNNASISLPATFRKLDGFPKITYDGTNTEDFTPVDFTKNSQYTTGDKIANILGNNTDGKVLYIPFVELTSGASVQFPYWSSPVSLASATDITPCPDPTYIVQRALYYLYKGREDGRFPEAKVESEKIMARMIEQENVLGQAHSDNRVSNWNTTRYGYRIGRD